ncbi:class I SAM-dependent methyltransferase [Campylobacter estrildidarum]|uniref:SAM-dependent methyltransferase n=1 Tax=Campylobacter estrildidarum TaxID=2510189 RepID=A0A4U7BJN2_9BACT|nr:methyltransferase domain-containing protein [Campylobacter estrildidarum]TKX31799.1 SAM-dependent methyltransferase [Campylobacter estrildidarum]
MFFYYYLKNPKQVGALCPSSKKLRKVITQNIGLESVRNIVEIGPGTGAFTETILKKKHKDAKFFAVEINDKMAKKLSKKYENLDLQIGNAENLEHFLYERDMQNVDIVVSGIPWALLKDDEQEKLLNVIYRNLSKGGYFTTFAYILPSPSSKAFRSKIFKLFSEVKISKIVWQNVPPAVVYYCKK